MAYTMHMYPDRHELDQKNTGSHVTRSRNLIRANEFTMAAQKSRQTVSEPIRIDKSVERSSLVTHCPTCGLRLAIRVDSKGDVGSVITCARCKEVYRIEHIRVGTQEEQQPRVFRVSFGVEGRWNPTDIMEYLFDRIGEVRSVDGGFVCNPEPQLGLVPRIAVLERTRTVQFSLTGLLQEREAIATINQAVSEFGARFHLGLRPLTLERWERREDGTGLTLAERRPLGMLLSPRGRPYAHA